MKLLVPLSRLIVGLLFIVSGLIKLNDPIGFSFKLKEYFSPGVLNLEFLIPVALLIAIFVVIFEVLLGITILLGYAKKFTVWSLLLMILFFTFLTFYSAYFNKVTDCGCFGDAIKLTPWESFTKDIILLLFILILFYGRKYISPIFSDNVQRYLVLICFIGCMTFAYHVLQHLPVVDFRPYKIGANLTEGMSVPEDAPKALFEYKWTFVVNGEEKVVTTSGDYPDQEGEFKGVETKMITEGYVPPIHDFTMERNQEDFLTRFLATKNLIVVVAYNLVNSEYEGFDNIKSITDAAIKKGYKVIALSASSLEDTEALKRERKLNFDFYFCDETTLKTIVRSNPGILELQEGTVMQKLHWNDALDLKLESLVLEMPVLEVKTETIQDSLSEK